MTLDPMNAYERHIIHAALQDNAHVTTFSIGSEPNRRVVVAFGHKNQKPDRSPGARSNAPRSNTSRSSTPRSEAPRSDAPATKETKTYREWS